MDPHIGDHEIPPWARKVKRAKIRQLFVSTLHLEKPAKSKTGD